MKVINEIVSLYLQTVVEYKQSLSVDIGLLSATMKFWEYPPHRRIDFKFSQCHFSWFHEIWGKAKKKKFIDLQVTTHSNNYTYLLYDISRKMFLYVYVSLSHLSYRHCGPMCTGNSNGFQSLPITQCRIWRVTGLQFQQHGIIMKSVSSRLGQE